MYPFYQEWELVKPVSDYFEKQGFVVREQVRIGFCRADIVAFKECETTGVELKLKDWKKAIIQVKNYQLGCDFVYLAVPLSKVYNILRKADHILKREGIGLLTINDKTYDVKKIIDAKNSDKQLGKTRLEDVDKNMFKCSRYKFL